MSKSKKDLEEEKITNELYNKTKKSVAAAAASEQEEEEEEEGEGAVSRLDPSSIRWMNKRRPLGAAV